MAKLVVKTGQKSGSEYFLTNERMLMGRRSANPVPIADPKASRDHAAIFCKDKVFYVQDLSRNGTFLNGRPASKTDVGSAMKFGDRIKIGDTELEMVDEKNEPIKIEIPGYTILEQIGSGGMGMVYKARQLSMDRVVAMKVLNERYSSNSEFVDRFIREARAAGKLNHPNVIHVHDISRANGRHYFSMEFIDGASVKELQRAEKKIDLNKALDIVLQAAKALEFAHENRIVHRDVKPDNIMLTREGIVKIADLGIAKTFEETSAKERRVMGTPHYMAPEQALGKTIDHRVDIYSLGATFYHMITGSTPYGGSSANEILKAHIQDSLPAIQELNSAIPDPVCFIIERMMAKMPEKRYPDMTTLIGDIERVQRGNVAGINRIPAGESTILRAIKDGAAKKKEPQKGDTAELEAATGPQGTVITRALTVVALIVVFFAIVGAVVLVARHINEANQPGASGPDLPNPGAGGTPLSRSNPDAKKLLNQALALNPAEDPSGYEKLLKEVIEKYPASMEKDEALKRLEQVGATTKAAGRAQAETLAAEAKAFESANPGNPAEAVKKYRKAMDAARNYPELFEPLKTSLEALDKRATAEIAKQIDAAYRAAIAAASSAKNKQDYDGARAALQQFMQGNANAPQKADAQTALDKLNADAEKTFKSVQESAAAQDIPGAIAAWETYVFQVKDLSKATEVDAARKALESKSDAAAQDGLLKCNERARKFDFVEALKSIRVIQRSLSGITKWDDELKKKEESLKRQKELHEKVMALANDKLSKGPQMLAFFTDTRFPTAKWNLTRINGDQLSLDPVPANSAPGLPKKIYDFQTIDQYNFYMTFLPKEPGVEEHKALAAFCMERELVPQAEIHLQKSNATPPPP